MMIIILVIQIKDQLEELFGLTAKIMMTIVLLIIMIDKDDKDNRPACGTVWIAAFGKLSARPRGLQSSGPLNP